MGDLPDWLIVDLVFLTMPFFRFFISRKTKWNSVISKVLAQTIKFKKFIYRKQQKT